MDRIIRRNEDFTHPSNLGFMRRKLCLALSLINALHSLKIGCASEMHK